MPTLALAPRITRQRGHGRDVVTSYALGSGCWRFISADFLAEDDDLRHSCAAGAVVGGHGLHLCRWASGGVVTACFGAKFVALVFNVASRAVREPIWFAGAMGEPTCFGSHCVRCSARRGILITGNHRHCVCRFITGNHRHCVCRLYCIW